MALVKNKASCKYTGFHVPFKFNILVMKKHGLTLKITETSNQPQDKNSNDFTLWYVYFKSSNVIQFYLLVNLSCESWLLKNSNYY